MGVIDLLLYVSNEIIQTSVFYIAVFCAFNVCKIENWGIMWCAKLEDHIHQKCKKALRLLSYSAVLSKLAVSA